MLSTGEKEAGGLTIHLLLDVAGGGGEKKGGEKKKKRPLSTDPKLFVPVLLGLVGSLLVSIGSAIDVLEEGVLVVLQGGDFPLHDVDVMQKHVQVQLVGVQETEFCEGGLAGFQGVGLQAHHEGPVLVRANFGGKAVSGGREKGDEVRPPRTCQDTHTHTHTHTHTNLKRVVSKRERERKQEQRDEGKR